MKLAKSSKLIQFAYLTRDPEALHIPNRTTLCALFWRCCGAILALLVPTMLVISYITELVFNTRRTLIITGWILCGLALVSGTVYLCHKVEARHRRNRFLGVHRKPSLVTEALWGFKHKVCPIIELVDPSDVENDGV